MFPPSDDVKMILWFADISKDDAHRAGAKGARLAELFAAGVPVPPGFVVSAQACASFLQETGLGAAIKRGLADHNLAGPAVVELATADIKRLIALTSLPEEL